MENIVNNINTEVTSTNPERLHTVLIVSFETTKKRYYFEVLGNKRFKKNDRVIVETIRGTELGIASNDPIQMKEKDLVLNKWNERFLNAILSKEDYKISEKYLKEYLKNIILKNSTENFDETEKVIPANTYKNIKREFKIFVEKLNNIIYEELKEKDQMEWVRIMNSLLSSLREITYNQIIYK